MYNHTDPQAIIIIHLFFLFSLFFFFFFLNSSTLKLFLILTRVIYLILSRSSFLMRTLTSPKWTSLVTQLLLHKNHILMAIITFWYKSRYLLNEDPQLLGNDNYWSIVQCNSISIFVDNFLQIYRVDRSNKSSRVFQGSNTRDELIFFFNYRDKVDLRSGEIRK